MGNILFEHNRKAYKAALCLMQETGRAAVIHPTGTGKSFLAFKLCVDHPEKKVCWLSPSEYIFQAQREKWLLAGGKIPENAYFITYAKLMRMNEEELLAIGADYLVLDEFHRLGAAQWGASVERLRRKYPEAKILGLSATNIRYLDNRRDMAWELFGGNIASELTLGTAIASGILPAPKYVLSVYSYQSELIRYKRKIYQTKKKAVREAAEQELEALRRALEKADGLSEVFARHMLPEGLAGKYLVFCANFEHLNEMRALAAEWFAKVDPAPHIYTAYSGDMATEQEFAAFKTDTSAHLKLLYCIDMLNEGIHIEGLSGVILLRPTISPIIYKQQIGRALAAGGKKQPVIFDIVMNIENLCSIGAIEEEWREAVLFSRTSGHKDSMVQKFQIVDEIADCRKLFIRLNKVLGASWEAMFAMAQEYYQAHGNLDVPRHYITPEGYSLGTWLSTQRKVYAGKVAGVLNEGQIEKLNSLGMRWQNAWEVSWEKYFAQAEEYYRKNGDLDIASGYVTENGCKLGRWIKRQREICQKIKSEQDDRTEKLSQYNAENEINKEKFSQHDAKNKAVKSVWIQRIERLEKIGMKWETSDSWEERFALAKQYFDKNGNLNMPGDYVVKGIWLDRWLREQKRGLREEEGEKPLTKEQKEKLQSIGISGCSRMELSWRQQYDEAREFFKEHGNLSIPKRYVGKSGKNLRIWLQRQRAGRRRGQLSSEQVALLDGIGMIWNPDTPWNIGFSHAEAYYKQYGHLAVPNNYICADGYRLGKWISNQRSAERGAQGLKSEQIEKLKQIGMLWSAKAGRREKDEGKKEREREKKALN